MSSTRLAGLATLAITALSLSLAPSAALAAKRRPPPDVVEDALAYAETDLAKAIELLEGALSDGPSASDIDVIELHLGEQLRLDGKGDAAHDHFRSVVQRLRKGSDREAARLGMALIAAGKSLDANTIDVLEDVSDKDALPSQDADRHLALTVHAAQQGDAKAVEDHARRALAAAVDDAQRARIDARLAQLVDVDPASVPPGLSAGAGPSKDPLADALAALEEGDADRARKLAEKAAESGDAATAELAKGLLRALDGAAVDTNVIAVILPLSGKYAAVGQQIKEALEFGFGTSARRLVTYDSGATPESAVAALEKAVLEDGAIAVVGPLLSDETAAMVAAAESLHVPMVSLSQSYEDRDDARFALQGMYTRRDQIHALVGYLVDEKAFTRFATFHPDNAFGSHAAEAFAAEVSAKGGEVKHTAPYEAETQNLLPFARKLGKRQGNLWELRKEAEAHGGNPDTVVVPPIIDFDALFLPESATRTPLAAAALAYEEFPMGDFRPKKDSPTVPLIGLSSWNTPQLIASGNEYTRNSLFPDVFSAAAETDPAFTEAYRGATGRTPSALEATAVDVGKLLATASKARADNRPAFLTALMEAKVADTVTGATHIAPETHGLDFEMHILTITREALEVVATVDLDGKPVASGAE